MHDSNRAKIRDIKSKIVAMLEERHSLEGHPSNEIVNHNDTSVIGPSKYWSDFCSYFDYMLGLSEESFAKLRLHTYHLTGDNYQHYYFGDPKDSLSASNIDAITKDLPPTFIINEPEGGIGFHYANDRFMSVDSLRYQQVLGTFYRYGVLPEASGADQKRRYVLEVGGGYGGLAHHFSNIYGDVTYIMVDLPETLIFSASYLSLLNPQKNMYVYEKNSFQELLQSNSLDSFDFILLPNYVLDSLSDLRFDLVINQASFQEMRLEQVEMYLDFIRKTCKGVLYSWNQDHKPRNKELSNLSDLISQRFDVVEVIDTQQNKKKPKKSLRLTLKNRLKRTYNELLGRPQKPETKTPELSKSRYHEYICRPLVQSNKVSRAGQA